MRYFALILMILLSASTSHAETPTAPAAPKAPEAKAKLAVKLAGLVIFVAHTCPRIKPDYDRFKAVVPQLGMPIDDLSKEEIKIETMNYASAYQKDADKSCERATAMFGEHGTSIPGVFVTKTDPASK